MSSTVISTVINKKIRFLPNIFWRSKQNWKTITQKLKTTGVGKHPLHYVIFQRYCNVSTRY